MKLLALSLFLIAACNAAPDHKLEPPAKRPQPYASSYVRPDLMAICLAPGDECGAEIATECCQGSFCNAELFVYGPATCIAPQADGAYCQTDAHCSGGQCVGNICNSGVCADETEGCDDSFPCCEGLVCELFGYVEGICVPPFENGSFCSGNEQCQSGLCLSNICADPSCRAEGTECYDDPASCCPGLYCHQDAGFYGIAACGAPLPAGGFCLDNAACLSGSCTDNICL